MVKRRRRVDKRVFRAVGNVVLAVVLIAVAVLFILNYFGIKPGRLFAHTRDVSVHFIDVGQGDAALVLTKEHAVLVDAGPVAAAGKTAEYVRSYTSKLDYVLISHPHEDHMGGLPKIIETVEVDAIIMTADGSDSAFFTRTLDLIEEYGIDVYEAKPRDLYRAGDITLEILTPLRYHENKNDNSAAARVTVDGFSILFTGDTETEEEAELVAEYGDHLRSDVLKAAHHGSSTSTSREFLKCVSPSVAVISCGKGNEYGHPHASVLKNLKKIGCEIHRTDNEGTVVIRIKDGKLKVSE